MRITSKEQAFEILDTIRDGIPFDAIKYLYDYGKDEEILNKVIYYLENAFNKEVTYDEEAKEYLSVPLWYCILAESQVDERLIDPVIGLFINAESDSWDFQDEQGMYLIGMLCDAFGDKMITKCIKACMDCAKNNIESPYLYLYEFLHFTEVGKYTEEIITLIEIPNHRYKDFLYTSLGLAKFHYLLPKLKELKKGLEGSKPFTNESMQLVELNYAISSIENPELDEQDLNPYYKTRENWKEHYVKYTKTFQKSSDDEKSEIPMELVKALAHHEVINKTVFNTKKISRNAPCPCGSGKKYKRCCLK